MTSHTDRKGRKIEVGDIISWTDAIGGIYIYLGFYGNEEHLLNLLSGNYCSNPKYAFSTCATVVCKGKTLLKAVRAHVKKHVK